MSTNGRVIAAVAAIAASLVTGFGASPERELVFFLVAGAGAGFLHPEARRWVPSMRLRVLGGSAVGFLACYARFAPWLGASLPGGLEENPLIMLLSLALKSIVLFALIEGLYARLREEGLIGT